MMTILEHSQTPTPTPKPDTVSVTATASEVKKPSGPTKSKHVFEDSNDTGSGVSVIEDGEPVAIKSDLSSSCHVDVDRIREKIKKRNFVKRKRVEEIDDGDDWIERELENGIVLESGN